jgi:CoA:oxalate CoA-transferase
MGPLRGIKVVECGSSSSGAWAATMLSDLGAAVVRVETSDGEPCRRFGRPDRMVAAAEAACKRSNRSTVLDPTSDRGVCHLLEMVEGADVFLSDWRPGLAERLGIGDDELEARNRGLIRCWVRGSADDPVDRATSTFAVQAILAALYVREQTGRGERIDVAMLDVMAYVGAADLSVGRIHVDTQSQGTRNDQAAFPAPLLGGEASHEEWPDRYAGRLPRYPAVSPAWGVSADRRARVIPLDRPTGRT